MPHIIAEKKKLEARKRRGIRMSRLLKELYPEAKIALKFKNNWELLVAVELSAQCTDKMVNIVTADLFKKYKKLEDYINASPARFAKDIKKTGFYRNKTKNILAAAKLIKEKYKGKIPNTMEDILLVPGVARKTANVVLGNAYGIVEGIAVDTHVKRFSRKFDLSDYKDPVRIEKDLMKIFPKKEWLFITYGFIEYGRHICKARKHECSRHPLTKIYPRAANIWPMAR
jgi:endonuclease III